VTTIRRELKLEPTGRPAKSTTSVVDKLRRESIRLSQMQDIAGCRLIVQNVIEQNRIVRKLRRRFQAATVIDRRKKPSHGYRAVHVIVTVSGKAIEIQVRSRLQHLWAEVSERLSDSVGAGLKYGGGPTKV
jgi:putative GTP pyrophosphokinase